MQKVSVSIRNNKTLLNQNPKKMYPWTTKVSGVYENIRFNVCKTHSVIIFRVFLSSKEVLRYSFMCSYMKHFSPHRSLECFYLYILKCSGSCRSLTILNVCQRTSRIQRLRGIIFNFFPQQHLWTRKLIMIVLLSHRTCYNDWVKETNIHADVVIEYFIIWLRYFCRMNNGNCFP